QQLAARHLEADVAQDFVRGLAYENSELTLERPPGQAGCGREVGKPDVAAHGRLHGVERAPHAARQHGRIRDVCGAFSRHRAGPDAQVGCAGFTEGFRGPDSFVAFWIGPSAGPPYPPRKARRRLTCRGTPPAGTTRQPPPFEGPRWLTRIARRV